jgi:hypothetical protein
MALWPVTLPQIFEQSGYKETLPDMMIRTKMDTGPAKVRKRFTAAPYSMSGNMRMTKAQTDDLDTFYLTTTNGGADAFTFIHPRKGTTLSCRFMGAPGYISLEHDFNVSLSFEVLP